MIILHDENKCCMSENKALRKYLLQQEKTMTRNEGVSIITSYKYYTHNQI